MPRHPFATEVELKHFFVSVSHGSTELADQVPDLDLLEDWLQEQFIHVTSRVEGNGRVRVTPLDELRIDVRTTFVVAGSSVVDVMDRFRRDFELLQGMVRGIDIAETKTFKLCFPTISGERLDGIFVRVDPESG